MRKFVFIAEVICFAGAAGLGCIYSDRLNREREFRAHIEAVGAKALSTARAMQGDIQRLSSSLDSRIAKIEDCYSKATNDLAGLRQEWESKPNEKIRQILAEAGSKLAEQGQQLVAAREAKARVKSALEPLSADLAEIEGMAITNETTLTMVAQRVRECYGAFSDVKQSPDIAEIVRMQYRLRSHVARIINKTLHALSETVIIYDPAPRNPVSDHEDIDMESDIVRQKIDLVMQSEGLKTLQWKKARDELQEVEKGVAKDKNKALVHDAIFRIDLMESVHKLLVANAKGVVFIKSKLRGCEVLASDGSGLRLLSPDKKNEECIPWQVFYASYHGNLNELFGCLIEKARTTGKTADGVSFDDESWGCAMLGAALAFMHICEDDPAAWVRAEQLAIIAVRKCPSIRAKAVRAIPQVVFDKEDD